MSGMLPKEAKGWLATLEKQGYSASTIRAYKGDILQLAQAETGKKGIWMLGVGRKDLAVESLCRAVQQEEGVRASTKARRARAVMSLAQHLRQDNYHVLFDTAVQRKIEEAYHAITQEEYGRLLEHPTKRSTQAIGQLSWETGMRLSELIEVRHNDIDLQVGTLAIPRGRSPRNITLPPEAKTVLQRYKTTCSTNNLYFTNEEGEKISTRQERRRFQEWFKKAGLDHLTPQSLRYGHIVQHQHQDLETLAKHVGQTIPSLRLRLRSLRAPEVSNT